MHVLLGCVRVTISSDTLDENVAAVVPELDCILRELVDAHVSHRKSIDTGARVAARDGILKEAPHIVRLHVLEGEILDVGADPEGAVADALERHVLEFEVVGAGQETEHFRSFGFAR